MTAWLNEKVGAGTLLDHSGGRFVDRGGLVGLYTPEATATWKPVPHADLVDALMSGLDAHEIKVNAERYCIAGKQDARIFGLLDVEIPHLATPEYSMVLGFRAANDQSLAVSAIAGARVTVCSNLALSGEGGVVVLYRKHSTRLDLTKVIPPAIDNYLDKCGQFVVSIKDMQQYELTDSRAKEIIYDALVADPVMNRRLWPVVDRLYFKSDEQRSMFPERTLWALNNSFTQAVKELPPVVQDRSQRAIGRFFAKLVNQSKPGKPLVSLDWGTDIEDDSFID